MAKQCADDVRVAYPLFQTVDGGSSPTSALQLRVARIGVERAVRLNRAWHSRLPEMTNAFTCRVCYGAAWEDRYYAIAMWSDPVARMLNGRGWLELRRMAIADDAPPNTASRMLSVMARMIRKDLPDVKHLISYQDTEVHTGTIYKAAGWIKGNVSETGWGWESRPDRQQKPIAPGAKVRWERAI